MIKLQNIREKGLEQSKTLNRPGGKVATKNKIVKEGCFNVDLEMKWYYLGGDPFYADFKKKQNSYKKWLKKE